MSKLSQTHKARLGQMNLTKGQNQVGETIYAWDCVQKCLHQDCPALSHCSYEKNVAENGDCRVMRAYVKAVSALLWKEGADSLPALERYRIGMHIIPLYKTLCKLKIEEIGVTRACTKTARGALQMNPLYKEIRDTIRAIDTAWNNLAWQSDSEAPRNRAPGASGKLMDFGDSYYDAMEKEAFAEMDEKVTPLRRKKR